MKHRVALLGIMLSGALLVGIGAGISFWEYSSFHYLGEKVVGKEDIVTEEYRVSRDPEKEFSIEMYAGIWDGTQIEIDDTIPDDELVFELSYNEKLLSPRIHKESQDDGDEKEEFLVEAYYRGDTGMIWEEKDELLENLKNKTFYSYKASDWEGITVKMSSAAREKLRH